MSMARTVRWDFDMGFLLWGGNGGNATNERQSKSHLDRVIQTQQFMRILLQISNGAKTCTASQLEVLTQAHENIWGRPQRHHAFASGATL
jgi:hypothetical protein